MATYKQIMNEFQPRADYVRARLDDYVYSNCSNPHKVKLFDPYLGRFVYREIPCGNCWSCMSHKSHELSTRMFLHNEDWPHRYFVTLSYAPIPIESGLIHDALANEFAVTLPVRDTLNARRSDGFHPCVLSRFHLVNYFKRLRLLAGVEISYYAVGEYGKTFGRPHYHLIVWSKVPLDLSIFSLAWSKRWCVVNGVSKPYRNQANAESVTDISFGDVDACDLNCPTYQRKKGQTFSDVFKYVSKYVFKSKWDDESEYSNSKNTIMHPSSQNIWRMSKVFSNFAPEILQNLYYYDYKCTKNFSLNESEAVDNVSNASCEPTHMFTTSAFRKRFCPFALYSRKYALGKDYLLRNLKDLASGAKKLPKFGNFTSRFPSYYSRKIKQYTYSLRFSHTAPNGFTHSLGCLANASDIICKCASDTSLCCGDEIRQLIDRASELFFRRGVPHPKSTPNFRVELFDCIKNVYFIPDSLCRDFGVYRYSKKQGFTPVSKISFIDFASLYGSQLENLVQMHEKTLLQVTQEEAAKDAFKCACTSVGLNYDKEFVNSCDRVRTRLNENQRKYFLQKRFNKSLYE